MSSAPSAPNGSSSGGGGARRGGKGPSAGRGRGRGGGARSAPPAPASVPASTPAKPEKAKRKPATGSARARPSRGASGGGGGGGGAAMVRKVLIRNIPPAATLEDVWALVEAQGVARESLWRFVAGRVRGGNRPPTPARLYLDLKKDHEQAQRLIVALNGHVLGGGDAKDPQGALDVDFAPYQKVPREKQRKDAKMGTIERDPEYLAFLDELAKPKEKLPSAEAAADSVDAGEGVEKPVAALVKYMNERKLHSRDKGK
ncbi:hypothetical protein PybrP1_006110, partial [[Pythium] brassicae (nom. inval.)]